MFKRLTHSGGDTAAAFNEIFRIDTTAKMFLITVKAKSWLMMIFGALTIKELWHTFQYAL